MVVWLNRKHYFLGIRIFIQTINLNVSDHLVGYQFVERKSTTAGLFFRLALEENVIDDCIFCALQNVNRKISGIK
jgi:hypothetical protein